VIQSIEYATDAITYTKFDRHSTERFKLGLWTPKSVSGGTMRWNPETKVLTVQATEKSVRITRAE